MHVVTVLDIDDDVEEEGFSQLTMGNLFGYFSGLFGSKERRILILGLDGAGKTTILYRLQVSEVVTTIPTIGFNVETVQYKNLKFQVWDLGTNLPSLRIVIVHFFQVVKPPFVPIGVVTIPILMRLSTLLIPWIVIELVSPSMN